MPSAYAAVSKAVFKVQKMTGRDGVAWYDCTWPHAVLREAGTDDGPQEQRATSAVLRTQAAGNRWIVVLYS